MTQVMRVSVLLAGIVAAAAGSAGADERPWLIVNEDNDHYFKMDASRMNEASLKAYVDGIADGGEVTHLFFCVAGQRASYDSKAWEPIWKGLGGNGWNGKPENNVWCVIAKRLFDAGVDPYRVWLDRARERGISPWLSLRVNDAHGTTISNHFRVAGFYWAHPEWTRVPGSKSDNWYDHAFDFAHPEVRDYTFAMAREIVTRYRPDGFELDFMRVDAYFRDGEVAVGAALMTDLVRRIRAVARSENVRLSVRVPATPAACDRIGLDVLAWCREGLVDLVVPSSYYFAMPFAAPVGDWKRRVAAVNPSVRVIPGTDMNLAFDRESWARADSAAYRGWASTMYAQGAEGLYLFNVAYHPLENVREPDLDRKIYSTGFLRPSAVTRGSRRFVRSFDDLHGVDAQHPGARPIKSGDAFEVVLPDTVACREAGVVFGFDRAVKASDVAVSVNGHAVHEARPTYEPHKFGRSRAALRWNVPSAALKGGKNAVAIALKRPLGVTWCEIELD